MIEELSSWYPHRVTILREWSSWAGTPAPSMLWGEGLQLPACYGVKNASSQHAVGQRTPAPSMPRGWASSAHAVGWQSESMQEELCCAPSAATNLQRNMVRLMPGLGPEARIALLRSLFCLYQHQASAPHSLEASLPLGLLRDDLHCGGFQLSRL